MTPRIYLDLDGVMADFNHHFPATFNLDHRNLASKEIWAKINAHPNYFLDMPPCLGALDFFQSIERLQPIVLTACSKDNFENNARQKRAWVHKHLSPTVTVLPVHGSRFKPMFMHAPGDILIDDYESNIGGWNAEGGIGIHHTDFPSTEAALVEALQNWSVRR